MIEIQLKVATYNDLYDAVDWCFTNYKLNWKMYEHLVVSGDRETVTAKHWQAFYDNRKKTILRETHGNDLLRIQTKFLIFEIPDEDAAYFKLRWG